MHAIGAGIVHQRESALNRHRQNFNLEESRLSNITAREEWNGVATVEPAFKESVDPRRCTPHINVHQALVYFQGLDLSQEMSVAERRGLCTFLFCLLGPPQLDEHLVPERDLVFAITQCKLDLENPIHYRMLQTVYQRLTGTRLDCSCYGSHWQQIGFQGNDPGTDLRGVGMLGLLQLLYLAGSPHLMPLARDIYRVSLDEQQNFPLAVLSLNMTRMALQTLRQGLLNRECNERQMVVEVVNEFYAAIFCHTLHIWTSQHKTIRDSGYVLKDVEWFCRSNVRSVLRNFHAQLNSYASHSLKAHNSTLCLQGSFHDLLTQAKTEVFI
ncbi:ELMO domain-containing protein 3-like isoform X2 [Bacillus rossius redtenbacheri]|uniref:ELMO domain-containing protein 3-like isoform X2 n=1 Tax=Bacillus rossius redtenbacheri TaxID=93214 RepID=UPI002FDE5A6E